MFKYVRRMRDILPGLLRMVEGGKISKDYSTQQLLVIKC